MKVFVSAQDPGGANSVAPVAEALMRRGDTVVAQVEGAARDIFAKRGIPSGMCEDPQVVLVGTSGGESIEKCVTGEMRGKAPVVAVLDFWSNYWQRFSLPGVKDFAYLPDRVCVMDDAAKEEMVAEGFPPERLAITGNPHFDHFAAGVTRDHEDPKRILFISQPIRDDGALPGFMPAAIDEYAILAALIAVLPSGHYVSIRLHPRDARDKYDSTLGERVRMASEPSLEAALSASAAAVGGATPVLLQAAAVGKRAVLYAPEGGSADILALERLGIPRAHTPEALSAALAAPPAGAAFRAQLPLGATERVLAVMLALVGKK